MKLTDLALLSLQTAFMQRDLTTKGMCAGIEGHLREAAESTYNILMFQALNTMEESPFGHQLVDELAWQFHTDYYDKTADFSVKKALVKQSIRIHQKKGTPQAIIDLLTTAFPSDTLLLEWFDYGGKPYHFKIITSDLSAVDRAKFLKALNSVKNTRSYLEELNVFTAVINYALNNIRRDLTIEYEHNGIVSVGEQIAYEFPTGDVLTFNDNEAFSFYE